MAAEKLQVGDYGFDLSRDWLTITGADVVSKGAKFVIVYTGCDDTSKNVSKTRFDDYLSSGLAVALVIENSATSLQGGKPVGQAQGAAVVDGASALGYDYQRCVLFAAADWNSQSTSDLSAIQQALLGFSESVPVPGLYGNSFALNLERLEGWQSDSQSFSDGVSQYAVLLQKYNDPRAGGLDVDVNVIQHLPLRFMGETVTGPTDASIQQDVQTVLNEGGVAPGQTSAQGTEVATLETVQQDINEEHKEEGALAAIQTALTNLAQQVTAANPVAGTYTVTGTLTVTKSS